MDKNFTVKQLAEQVMKHLDRESGDSLEDRMKLLRAYMLGLLDGIATKDTEPDTCTKCGKKTGEPSYVLGCHGLYCPECAAMLCKEPESKCTYGHVVGRDFSDYADCAKCAGATYFKCKMKKEKEQGNNEKPEKTPRIKEIPSPNKNPKCCICGNTGDLLNVLCDGRILSICDHCRKALEDPKVQEALHKG